MADLAAGWRFWLVSFAVLYGPAWYWVSRNAYDDMKSGMFPWAAAFVLATLGAGLVSFAVNSTLRSYSRRAHRSVNKKRHK